MVPAFLMDEEVDFDLELMHVVAEWTVSLSFSSWNEHLLYLHLSAIIIFQDIEHDGQTAGHFKLCMCIIVCRHETLLISWNPWISRLFNHIQWLKLALSDETNRVSAFYSLN
jgi:hypothetical protein